MLRASSEYAGVDYDLNTISGTAGGDGGIPHGKLLVEFAEALLDDDEPRLQQVRTAIVDELSAEALVDSAAVAGLFNAIDRIADATGIPLEDAKAAESEDIRATLGVNDFASLNASS